MTRICSEVGSIQEAWSLNVIVHISCPEYPFERNKDGSDFNYRLKLPSLAHATNSKLISGNVNLLNLTALKVKQFKTSESHKAAVA